jgi:hypothetical protein
LFYDSYTVTSCRCLCFRAPLQPDYAQPEIALETTPGVITSDGDLLSLDDAIPQRDAR